MRFLLENASIYYLIQLVKVSNNKLLKELRFEDEDEAWEEYNKLFDYAQQEAKDLETLLELSITLMGNEEEELAVDYFDYE